MHYHYQGIDKKSEQRVSGSLEAVTKAEALRQLKAINIEVFAIDVKQQSKTKGRAVKKFDLVLPLRELSTLVNSGVSLIDALNALSQNEEHINLARGFGKLAAAIESGDSFSEAVVASELPFPNYIQPLVQAGELTGELGSALLSAAEQIEYEQGIKNDLRSAITYPIVLVFSGIAAMLLIFFMVVPKFSHMLDDERELPFLAHLVLSAGRAVNESTFLVIFVICLFIALLVLVFSNHKVRAFLRDASIKVPVLGSWLLEQDTAKWATLTSVMLNAKVDLISALRLAASASIYSERRIRAASLVDEIESGAPFTEAVKKSNLIPMTSLNLIAVGDKTGQLAKMLSAIAKLHDASCKRKMKQVLTLMEPIAILLVGTLIGIMILGIVLAITASTDIAI